MPKLKEVALQQIIRGGETATVEFKVAPPRPTGLAERLCGMANAQEDIFLQQSHRDTQPRFVTSRNYS